MKSCTVAIVKYPSVIPSVWNLGYNVAPIVLVATKNNYLLKQIIILTNNMIYDYSNGPHFTRN